MADKKISELTSASLPLAGTEVVPIVQGGETKKVAVSEFGGSTPSLQQVTDVGNTTTNTMETGNLIVSENQGGDPPITIIQDITNTDNFIVIEETLSSFSYSLKIKPPTALRDFYLEDESGTIATREWVNTNKKIIENHQFSTAGSNTIPNTNVNAAQVRAFNNSVFTNLSTSSGITETAGNLNLVTLSDVGKARVTGNYTSQVVAIRFTYRRDVAESTTNTNVMISIMADTRYSVDMQLIARYNLVSTTAPANSETKVTIPILSHLNLSPFSNLRWCIRSNNSTAQTFSWIDVNIITEEV